MLTHSSIPYNFAHCLASECALKDECLRWKAYELLPDDLNKRVTFINPKSLPPAAAEECPHFLKAELQCYAKGMRRIFDSVPHKAALSLKQQMKGYFGTRTYYRCVSGERLISPDEQNRIRKMFASRGLPSDVAFDEYIDQYVFE